MQLPQFLDVLNAQRRLRPYLSPSTLEETPALGQGIAFKLENTNPTHAFKIRGALNAIIAQADIAQQRGIVAASAGNHAIGVAYGAALAGAQATIVMPLDTPQRKVNGARQHGAHTVLHGAIYDDAEIHAHQLEQEHGWLYISPYNDPYVVAGQGTIALEIFDQRPQVQRLVVPTSGGGLLAGIALAAKHINPGIEVIGVQSIATPAMYNIFYDTDFPQQPTIADGLAGDIEPGAITVPICQKYADKIVLVEEASIIEAIRWAFQQHGWVLEGAAAVGIAAFLSDRIPRQDPENTVIILSGGNIDADKFLKLIQAQSGTSRNGA
ncbi:MAG: threonine/serine dehydratase [Chloroflexi bacterium]|nr:threonine/serine dehydratase [Chloroflexota bacterium]